MKGRPGVETENRQT